HRYQRGAFVYVGGGGNLERLRCEAQRTTPTRDRSVFADEQEQISAERAGSVGSVEGLTRHRPRAGNRHLEPQFGRRVRRGVYVVQNRQSRSVRRNPEGTRTGIRDIPSILQVRVRDRRGI